MRARNNQDQDLYGIGAVARLTGLTDHTIRVWERRYKAVVAERAANGRRVYTPADVEKLGLLKHLTDRGMSIGQIAGEDTATLRQRAQSMSEIGQAGVSESIEVAVVGDFLPGQIEASGRSLSPVDVQVADNNPQQFVADLQRRSVDVVVLESPVLDSSSIQQLRDYMKLGKAERGVLVYSFGRARDIDSAVDASIAALRAPVNVAELRAAVMRAHTPAPPDRAPTHTPEADSPWEFAGPIAPRRFNQQQLANLSRASTAIDCECPHHLAQLVGDLSAFEIYSANCANRDEEDAALHAYLHQTTAQARALIEVALQRVAEAEGLSF